MSPASRAGMLARWALLGVAALGTGPPLPSPRAQGDPADRPLAQLRVGEALGSLPRIGVNLGGQTAWGAEQLLANVLLNPGLEPVHDGAVIVVARADARAVEDDTPWTARAEGFWRGASFEVLSGQAAGSRGVVRDNQRLAATQGDRLVLDPMPSGLHGGDAIAVHGQQDPRPAPLWWTEGAVRRVADPRPGSPGRHAVQLQARAQPAALHHHLDNIGERAGKLLPVQGRWRFALWLRADTPGSRVQVTFMRHGRRPWLQQDLQPAPRWQAHAWAFDATDDGPVGPLQLSIRVTHGTVTADDLSLGLAVPGSPGAFRPELVQTLKSLRPGYLRDWQGQLADLASNRLAPAEARTPTRYRPGPDEMLYGHGVPDVLALAAAVGARPWLVLPSTTTPGQAREWGRYLAMGWREHRFDEIVVEHGNEHWNAIFRPAAISRTATLAEVSDRVFAALRDAAGPAVPLHRVAGTQYVAPAAAGQLAAAARELDGIAVAPYLHERQDAADSTLAALDRALHENVAPLREAIARVAATRRSVDVYEVNFHTTAGTASTAQRDAVLEDPAAGAALMRRLLQTATAGVRRQAVYSIAGHDTFTQGAGRALVKLFGITHDLTAASRWRPTGRAVQALNDVMAGTAHAASCTGAGCAELTAMAFDGGQRWAIVSSAPQALHVQLPCAQALTAIASAGGHGPTACRNGRATVEMLPRSWLTLQP